MKLSFRYVILYFTLICSTLIVAQGQFVLNKNESKRIDFEFIGNLIIIPIEINDVKLSFILDSGVNKPVLFNLTEQDSLDLKHTEIFYLHGLGGDGKIEALKSSHNKIRIGNAINSDQDLYVVFDKTIDFTPRLGVVVHGIIGYDIFRDFVVEINYNSKFIKLYKISHFKPKSSKKWKTLPLYIHRDKPYIDAKVTINMTEKPVKLLIDTGSSDALWLFEDIEEGFAPLQDFFFEDYLGRGLSGSIYGKRSKIKTFHLSDFSIENVNVAFPDSLSIDESKIFKGRHGSLGGEILKRFNHFIDYANGKLHLRKNKFYNDPFTYNNSGVVLEHNGSLFVEEKITIPRSDELNPSRNFDAVLVDRSINYIMALKPAYRIVEIRKTSNAYKEGIREGDILISINSKIAYNFKLQEITEMLHGKTGKTIRVKIDRLGKTMEFKFKLDDVLKKK